MKLKYFILIIACLSMIGGNVLKAQQTITVTSTADSGTGSLRQAITDANNSGGGTITVSPSLAGKTILLEIVLPEISCDMLIEGNSITISGQNKCQILRIREGASVTVNRVHFTNGKADYYYPSQDDWNYKGGGAVCSLGTLVLQSCIFSNNESGFFGGGVYARRNLTLSACTFIGNNSKYYAGAVYILYGNGSVYTGNIFYGNGEKGDSSTGLVGGILVGEANSRANSGGYNASANNHYNVNSAATDVTIPAGNSPVLPTSFRPVYGSDVANVIPSGSIPTGYPTVDFYGESIATAPLNAGAVKGMAAQGCLLQVSTLGIGIVTVTSATQPDADGICQPNSSITLQATPAGNKPFRYWLVNGEQAGGNATLTLTMDGDKKVEAVFAYIVTNLNNAGAGSLRQIIADAPAGETISFLPELAGGTIILSATLEIAKNLILEGNSITISGNHTCRIMSVKENADVRISRIHFTQGLLNVSYNDGGAAIDNTRGNLTLKSCIFSENEATGTGTYIEGGAISNGGTLTANGCTFFRNKSKGRGGAIYNTRYTGSSGTSPGVLNLTGNIFYDNIPNPVEINDETTSSSSFAYNLFNNESDKTNLYSYWKTVNIDDTPRASTNRQALQSPITPLTFRLPQSSEAIGMIPEENMPEDYPTVDFYGNAIIAPAAAGAVQEKVMEGYLLYYAAQGNGSVSVAYSVQPDAEGICSSGTVVTLQSAAEPNNSFLYWTVNGERIEENSATLQLTMDGDKTVNAVFASADASLSSLTVSAGELQPAFNTGTFQYEVNVSFGIDAITLSATKSNAKASITGTGSKTLAVGDNPFTIRVTAEDGVTVNNYTVNVIRAAFQKVEQIVDIVSAGTLKDVSEIKRVTHLILTGNIDARDFQFMRDSIETLVSLDLSGANIVAYEGDKGTSYYGYWDTFYPANELPAYAFLNDNYEGKKLLAEVILPDGLSSVGDRAFYDCDDLSSIVLPESLNSIADYAFTFCDGLSLVINHNPEPINITEYAFYSINYGNCTLQVPAGSVEAYRTADVWKNFNIVAMGSTTGITEANTGGRITLYPNPITNGQLTIESGQLQAGDIVTIYDIAGKFIVNCRLSNVNSIDVSALSAGVYIVKVGSQTAKFIKQ